MRIETAGHHACLGRHSLRRTHEHRHAARREQVLPLRADSRIGIGRQRRDADQVAVQLAGEHARRRVTGRRVAGPRDRMGQALRPRGGFHFRTVFRQPRSG